MNEDMLIRKSTVPFLAILLLSAAFGFAQAAPASAPPAGPARVSAIMQPALQQVLQTVGSLNTGRWKAPNEVKAGTDRNVSSIQRDVAETLPNLINQADGAAGSAAAEFAVYRNIDALYDVLLRVNQTAMLAAPDNEASAVESALERLESARRQLGDAIAASAQDNEAQIVRLQAAVRAAAVAPAAAAPKATVVDDGPAQPAAKPKKRKPAAKPATPPPAAGSSPAAPPPK